MRALSNSPWVREPDSELDYDYGVRLPAAAGEVGFQSIQIHLEQPAYLRGPEKRLWEHKFAETVPVVRAQEWPLKTNSKGFLRRCARLRKTNAC